MEDHYIRPASSVLIEDRVKQVNREVLGAPEAKVHSDYRRLLMDPVVAAV